MINTTNCEGGSKYGAQTEVQYRGLDNGVGVIGRLFAPELWLRLFGIDPYVRSREADVDKSARKFSTEKFIGEA